MVTINQQIIKQLANKQAKLVAVSKYLSVADTHEAYVKLKQFPQVFFGLGENRAEALSTKDLPRQHVHFIGNIQSRKIPIIVRHASFIHSVYKISHINTLATQSQAHNLPTSIWVQVKLSTEEAKFGISAQDLPELITTVQQSPLKLMGLSLMGASHFTVLEKQDELAQLKALANQNLIPPYSLSAGTSRDYALALASGIKVVRIGQALWSAV